MKPHKAIGLKEHKQNKSRPLKSNFADLTMQWWKLAIVIKNCIGQDKGKN
jgi:hypothetical protein